jgi:hypothetical protein
MTISERKIVTSLHTATHHLKLPRVGRRIEYINTSRILGRVSCPEKQCVQLCADKPGNVANPVRWVAKPSKSCRQLWRAPKPSSLGAHVFTQDSGNASKTLPLRWSVVALVHDPITVSHELLQRIRVEPVTLAAVTICNAKDLAERPTLLAPERLPRMQSRTYRLYASAIFINCLLPGNGNDVIAADGDVRTKRKTGPPVKKAEDSERQRSAHKASPLHGDTNNILRSHLHTDDRQFENLLPLCFGERLPIVPHMMLRRPNAKGLGSRFKVQVGETRLAKTAEHGLNCIMRETIGRLRQISTKVMLITAQDPCAQGYLQ